MISVSDTLKKWANIRDFYPSFFQMVSEKWDFTVVTKPKKKKSLNVWGYAVSDRCLYVINAKFICQILKGFPGTKNLQTH